MLKIAFLLHSVAGRCRPGGGLVLTVPADYGAVRSGPFTV